MSGKLADLAGYTHRVGEMIEFMRDHKADSQYWNQSSTDNNLEKGIDNGKDRDKDEESEQLISSVRGEEIERETSSITPDFLTLKNITILNPITNKSLVTNLSISLNQHTNVLIHGPPAAGKSSVLRTIKQLWEPLVGSIQSTGDIMFLPQRPYFTRQCLAAQITLPDPPKHGEDPELLGILETLGLAEILDDTQWNEDINETDGFFNRTVDEDGSDEKVINHEDAETTPMIPSQPTSFLRRLFTTPSLSLLHSSSPLYKTPRRSWHKLLSPGQQQLLAFSRVLYHKPRVVIMDEATSAVSGDLAKVMYDLLRTMGVCYLSVSHDEGLDQFHDKVILLMGDGQNWRIKKAKYL